jgi:serine/threonine protein kinase
MPEAEHYQHYEVLRRPDGSLWELGRGAMGITYKAYDTNLRCTVALKVINSTYLANDTARQRFLREARAAAALRHPNVAAVFNLGTDQDNYFYVMEFIDGETVETCVKRKGRLEPAEALTITLQVTRALAAAARERLVHRDLKPSNLMLVEQDGESIVKVIDFGLAKSAKETGEDTAALTVGGFVGTPHFASPEQVEEGDLDIRSDIYSLGATLYFMVAGKAPFSGSVAQVMTQHLYKPINIEALTNVPRCVVSLIQRMLEKDRNQRPQTPRDLQAAIVACLEEIRGHSSRIGADAVEESPQPLVPGTLLAQNYRLIEELRESQQGRHFLAEDVRQKRPVSLLILRQELVSDPHWFTPLQTVVDRLRSAPHPMLRAIYSLEKGGGHSILVEERVAGPSLLDLLRSRSVLSAPEVVRLINLLAPLADHANAKRLEHVELTLLGIHFVIPESTAGELLSDLLRRPLTTWEQVEAKVNAIDFSFSLSQAGTMIGMETRMQGDVGGGPRDSYVRSLSLLAYELLGGPRARVEATGRYNPVAALTRDGNSVLRHGLIDEYSSAAELARQLANAAGVRESTTPVSERIAPIAAITAHATSEPVPVAPPAITSAPVTAGSVTPEPAMSAPAPPIAPPEAPTDLPSKRKPRVRAWQTILIGVIVFAGIGGCLIFLTINQGQELAALSVQSDPPGAVILLDGKPPQSLNTFSHVSLGTHRLTAALDNYEPVKQDVEVRQGMAPEIHLKLKPSQEIAALSVRSDPPGASILLDGKPPQSPNTFTHVPFGTHQLTATLNDYESIKQDVEVRRGMTPEIQLKLKPSQEIAALSVQSDPPGASILLDGKPPQSPNTFAHVPFGTHQLTATLNDYESIKQDVEVRRGMAPEIRLKLKQIQELAALSVQSDPPGASILLDGKPPQTQNSFAHVPFGTHQLTATLDKYEPIKQNVEVRRGMVPEIRVKLNRKPDSLPDLLAETKKYDEDSPEYLAAYVRLVQFVTTSGTGNSGEYTNQLGRTIERHQTKAVSKDEFNLFYKGSVKEAANLNLLPAILWLADNEKGREAFSLFLRAANLGDSSAMMNVGRLYLYRGTPTDDEQAVAWLKRAYESSNPNLEAGAYLGFCYLYGRGTKKDVEEGKKIIMALADQNVVPAMTQAGILLATEAKEKREEAERSTLQRNRNQLSDQADELEVQARHWWERATEKEDWNAAARLGLFYQEGLGGLKKSSEEAEKRYQEGVKHENNLSKYYYAQFLLEKKPERRSEAENLMSQAATAGIQSARIWCKANKVSFTEALPEDEQQ